MRRDRFFVLPFAIVMLASLARAQDLPLQVPNGWKDVTSDDMRTMTPEDLAAGKLYTVLVPKLVRKVGTLRGLVAEGKQTLSDVAPFKVVKGPSRARNDAGWEYDVVIGTMTKESGYTLTGQVIALRKGSDEGLVLVVADGLETMEKYSDAFTAMIRNLGTQPAAGRAAKVDLAFALPEGWSKKEDADSTLLEGSVAGFDNATTVFRVLVLPSEPLTGSLRSTYLELWASCVEPVLKTSIRPLPFMHRLKSGTMVAFDVDEAAKDQKGATLSGGLFLLARGKRVVPVMTFWFNHVKAPQLEQAFESFLESAVVPGVGAGAVEPFSAGDLEGEWSEASSVLANYVTRGGDYAGDASIAAGSYMTLSRDGRFTTSAFAVTATRRIKETDEGTWQLAANVLTLTGRDRVRRFTLFAFGTDPKVGAYLVRSTYADTDERPDLCRPRRAFSGAWFRRKG